MSYPKIVLSLLLTLVIFQFALAPTTFARTTPEDIYNEQKASYDQRLSSYSPTARQNIELVVKLTNDLNQNVCTQLENIVLRQGEILDAFFARKNYTETEAIKDARYWVTFSHEAIDYQKAHLYLPSLSSEANYRNDLVNMVNQLLSGITYAKSTAIKSEGRILSTIQGGGSQRVATDSGQGGGE